MDIIEILEKKYGRENSPVSILTDGYKRELNKDEIERLVKNHIRIEELEKMGPEGDVAPPFCYVMSWDGDAENYKPTQEDIDWANGIALTHTD